jgi:hypothetical protein
MNDETDYAADSSKHGTNIIMAQVEKIKGKAETSARAFWTSPPSEWISAQWDMLFITIAELSVTLCCLAVCFAYCCVIPMDDDEKDAYLKDGMLVCCPRFKLRRRRMFLRRQNSGGSSVTTNSQTSQQSKGSPSKSLSTADGSHSDIKSVGSLEDNKVKSLLQESGLIKNISCVRSFERATTPKIKVEVRGAMTDLRRLSHLQVIGE